MKAQGLWAAHLPPELGGGGFGQVRLGLMHEILGQCGYAPAIFGNNAPDSGNAELLALGANDEQKKKWLEPLLAGQVRSAFSMTEPGAGADPTLLATRAVRDGDDYVINGHKWFTSNGSVARLPHRHGGDRPRRPGPEAGHHVRRPRGHAGGRRSAATSRPWATSADAT